MEKVLFISGNGLGDNVMIIPIIEKYKKTNKNVEVHVATLKRFGNACEELYEGLGYKVHPIISDPWEIPFNEGMMRVVTEGQELAHSIGYPTSFLCHVSNQDDSWKKHKIYRFSEYTNIKLSGEEFIPVLKLNKEYKHKVLNILKKDYTKCPKFIVVHLEPGNIRKKLNDEYLNDVKNYCNIKKENGYKIVEIGSRYIDADFYINTDSMSLTKAFVYLADEVVAIDSIVMHIAGAFKKPIRTYWTITEPVIALPFWLHINNIAVICKNNKWEKYREDAINDLNIVVPNA